MSSESQVTISHFPKGVRVFVCPCVRVSVCPHLSVLLRDVVVDPHPPARVEAAGRLRQGLQQPQEPLNGVRGQPGVTQVSAALG